MCFHENLLLSKNLVNLFSDLSLLAESPNRPAPIPNNCPVPVRRRIGGDGAHGREAYVGSGGTGTEGRYPV